MKNILTIILLATFTLTNAQEQFFVTAVNGLSCRASPDVNSEKVGKLPYGTIVEMVSTTAVELSITDNEKIIEGNWVKIKYGNFPFIVSENTTNSYYQEAFVFDAFLEPLNKATIEIEPITKAQFDNYNIRSISDNMEKVKVTDLNEIKNLLSDKVTWFSQDDNEEYITIDSLKLENGQLLKVNQASNDYSVTAYYPEEEVLVFEGGHTSDFSISIKTGESLTTVGNPAYIVTSAYDDIRLNGHFPGQECSDYFFQEIVDGKLIYLTNFGWGSEKGDDVCNFKKFFWLRNKQFAYSYLDYSENHEDGVVKYKMGSIVKLSH